MMHHSSLGGDYDSLIYHRLAPMASMVMMNLCVAVITLLYQCDNRFQRRFMQRIV
jgi:hypothetical protein